MIYRVYVGPGLQTVACPNQALRELGHSRAGGRAKDEGADSDADAGLDLAVDSEAG